jgi:hypothetical protein
MHGRKTESEFYRIQAKLTLIISRGHKRGELIN